MAEEHNPADDHAPATADAHAQADVAASDVQHDVLTEEVAAEIIELQDRALDSAELSRQLEDLTSVVLNSAEVSTRSASVADRKSTRLNSSHIPLSRMPSSA